LQTSPKSNATLDPLKEEKLKQKARENAEKEILEKKVKREYVDEISGMRGLWGCAIVTHFFSFFIFYFLLFKKRNEIKYNICQ
jgi:hypothetical protein